jgi:hypothetical protein
MPDFGGVPIRRKRLCPRAFEEARPTKGTQALKLKFGMRILTRLGPRKGDLSHFKPAIHLVVRKRVQTGCDDVGKPDQIFARGEKGARISAFSAATIQVMDRGVHSRGADIRVRIQIKFRVEKSQIADGCQFLPFFSAGPQIVAKPRFLGCWLF